MRAGETALTDPAVHDVGLDDGALPAEVLCHGGTAHLQVLHLWGGPAYLRPLHCTYSHVRRGWLNINAPTPASSPRAQQVERSRQTAPSPPASISPAVSLPGAEKAQPLPHLTALLAAGAGTEGCWIRTAGKRRGEGSPGSVPMPQTASGLRRRTRLGVAGRVGFAPGVVGKSWHPQRLWIPLCLKGEIRTTIS